MNIYTGACLSVKYLQLAVCQLINIFLKPKIILRDKKV